MSDMQEITFGNGVYFAFIHYEKKKKRRELDRKKDWVPELLQYQDDNKSLQ